MAHKNGHNHNIYPEIHCYCMLWEALKLPIFFWNVKWTLNIGIQLLFINPYGTILNLNHMNVWNGVEINKMYNQQVHGDRNSYGPHKTYVTAWIVAVAWIVAGDNSCRCSLHKSSPATIHAVSVIMNCRRRQFMPEISLMLCTSPGTIHAAWKISSAYIVAVGIFWRHHGLYLFIFFIIYIYCFFYLVKVQMIFCVIWSYTNLSNKNNPQNILYDNINVHILA